MFYEQLLLMILLLLVVVVVEEELNLWLLVEELNYSWEIGNENDQMNLLLFLKQVELIY